MGLSRSSGVATSVPSASDTRSMPSDDLIPSLLTLSDVMATGWFATEAANVKPGKDCHRRRRGGAVRRSLSELMGAERIIAMSRHESRPPLAREFGATDILQDRIRGKFDDYFAEVGSTSRDASR
jgi:Zn-dependent alcohol dehydrogenase